MSHTMDCVKENIKFDSAGLVPAIVQDALTKEVLMMAYMNSESLEITLREGYTCFWSRSRRELWRKGETSGNRQRVTKMELDCDGDTLLIQVIKDGPACHTGHNSCFFQTLNQDRQWEEQPDFSLEGLYEKLVQRRDCPREGSYTNYLFEKGREKILKKVGEEATEVIIAGAQGNREETVYEVADLTYHLLVALIDMGISLEQVKEELAKRNIIEVKKKQESARERKESDQENPR